MSLRCLGEDALAGHRLAIYGGRKGKDGARIKRLLRRHGPPTDKTEGAVETIIT